MAPLTVPAGTVQTFKPNSTTPYGIPWTNVSRWEPWFSKAAAESNVPAELIAAMAIVESNANHTWPSGPNQGEIIEVWDNFPQDGPSVGIMQVKPQLWGNILPGADAYTPQGNIRLGARLMRNFIDSPGRGSWEEAIKQDYHPWTSPQGTTPQDYVDTMKFLMAELGGGNGPCPPSAPPEFDGTQKTINDVVFHPDRRTVRAKIEGLNARRYATREACLTRAPLQDGESVGVLYWVRGQKVDGEDRWWVTEDGGRIWSGGTVETPLGG